MIDVNKRTIFCPFVVCVIFVLCVVVPWSFVVLSLSKDKIEILKILSYQIFIVCYNAFRFSKSTFLYLRGEL